MYNRAVSGDPYELLGVSRDASADEIRQAYRAQARRCHPDINKADGAEEQFKELGQAYAVLSDERRRALYDEFGEEALAAQFDPRAARAERRRDRGGADRTARRAAAGRSSGSRSVSRARVEASDPAPFRADPKGTADLIAPLEIDLLTAIEGADLSVPSPLGGAAVQVRVPAGVKSGQQLRVRGRGRAGVRGGRPGDLYLEIVVLPHPFFRREGHDLHLTLPITVNEAHQGATVEIPCLDGRLRLPVPPGSRGGELLRLRGKGPVDGEGRRGDLYVHLCVRLPDRLDAAGRALERLSALYSTDIRRDLHL